MLTTGANIKTKLDNKPFNNISFKRSNCVITLVALQKSVECKDKVVHFDPTPIVPENNFNSRTAKQI